MNCPKCKKEIPDESVFCLYCGKQVQPARRKPYHSNGNGCAFRKPGKKTWCARVTDMDNSRVDPETKKFMRKTIQKEGFKTELEARAWCIEWYQKKSVKQEAPSLSFYWDMYEKGELEKLSKSKVTAYRIAWKRLSAIAGQRIDTITISDLRNVVNEASTSYYTARDMKVVLSHLFELGGADRYCDKTLPSYIILPKLVETEKEVFTKEEQAKIWAAFDSDDIDAAWPLLMIYTGLMPGETMNITIPMIDFESMTITGAGLKTQVRKNATVYFPPVIVPVLESLISGRSDGKLFKINKDNLYKKYHAFTIRIGIRDLDPYCCRHTMATAMAVDQNIAPETLRRVMRWSQNSHMASRYVHPDDDAVSSAVGSLSRPVIDEYNQT